MSDFFYSQYAVMHTVLYALYIKPNKRYNEVQSSTLYLSFLSRFFVSICSDVAVSLRRWSDCCMETKAAILPPTTPASFYCQLMMEVLYWSLCGLRRFLLHALLQSLTGNPNIVMFPHFVLEDNQLYYREVLCQPCLSRLVSHSA